ncbi:MAG: hypothetical protein IJ249_03970 [Paludibacteraceae bacterium]|nr:hypothetical protein [Paludibacteraceae bacterium]
MEAVQHQQFGLNPMQLHLVSMLNFNNTEAAEQRLKRALEQFYLSEFEATKATMFANGELTEEMIERGAKKHFRTPY